MRGRRQAYPNSGRGSNRFPECVDKARRRLGECRFSPQGGASPKLLNPSWGQPVTKFGYKPVSTIANRMTPTDHGYVHRLGQSQDCELRGLGARGRTRQLNGNTERMGALGASIFPLNTGVPGVSRGAKFGRLHDAEILRYSSICFRTGSKENSPSGLWRTPGTRVGLTPSGVQIPHSPRLAPVFGPGPFCVSGLRRCEPG